MPTMRAITRLERDFRARSPLGAEPKIAIRRPVCSVSMYVHTMLLSAEALLIPSYRPVQREDFLCKRQKA